MSFLTDTDVNKRAWNLFVALTNTPAITAHLRFRYLTDILFFGAYNAAVPGIARYSTAINSGLGANLSVNQVGDSTFCFFDSSVSTTGAGLGAGTIPLGAEVCWETELLVSPSDIIERIGCGALIQGPDTPDYDADSYAGNVAQFGDMPMLTQATLPNTDVFVSAAQVTIQTLIAGDVVGFATSVANDVHVFLNGVEIVGSPFAINPAKFSSLPWVTLEFSGD